MTVIAFLYFLNMYHIFSPSSFHITFHRALKGNMYLSISLMTWLKITHTMSFMLLTAQHSTRSRFDNVSHAAQYIDFFVTKIVKKE